MPRKKKQLYEVDTSVFDTIQQTDVPKEKRINPKEITALQAIKALQDLGFKITPPSSSELTAIHDDSLELLGIVADVKVPIVEISTILNGTLHFSHCVGNATYGPGEFTTEDKDLFTSLLKQDQLCSQHFLDTARLSDSKCFIIQPGQLMAKSNFRKTQVSERIFNSNALWDEIAIMADNGGARVVNDMF